MMRSGTMNNTTVMAATVMYSNNISDEMQQQQQSKQIATKSFLRKGTRKEPSALHTFATTATAIITSVGNIGLLLLSVVGCIALLVHTLSFTHILTFIYLIVNYGRRCT